MNNIERDDNGNKNIADAGKTAHTIKHKTGVLNTLIFLPRESKIRKSPKSNTALLMVTRGLVKLPANRVLLKMGLANKKTVKKMTDFFDSSSVRRIVLPKYQAIKKQDIIPDAVAKVREKYGNNKSSLNAINNKISASYSIFEKYDFIDMISPKSFEKLAI